MKVVFIAGTRPEAIKIAPVYLKFKESRIDTRLVSTGQHEKMLYQVFELFNITADYEFNAMLPGQDLSSLSCRLIKGLNEMISKEDFNYIFVQGDTTSAFLGALTGFYRQIPVCHIEAGLRTGNIYNPFPEEANRKLIGCITNMHFAPTKHAEQNLLKEGYPSSCIFTVGNTVIDALLWMQKNRHEEMEIKRQEYGVSEGKYILMTMHRRESWGKTMRGVLTAVRRYLLEHRDYRLVFPLHLNPVVRDAAGEIFKGVENAILTDPLDYFEFLSLMEGCHYIMTDSGGIQEEAPSFGKPTLVLREMTERPEAIEAGTACLAGTNPERIWDCMKRFEGDLYSKMSVAANPYGDGRASERILKTIEEDAGRKSG